MPLLSHILIACFLFISLPIFYITIFLGLFSTIQLFQLVVANHRQPSFFRSHKFQKIVNFVAQLMSLATLFILIIRVGLRISSFSLHYVELWLINSAHWSTILAFGTVIAILHLTKRVKCKWNVCTISSYSCYALFNID